MNKKNIEKQKYPPQFSKAIENFCSVIAQAKSDYNWNKEQVNLLDKLTQDYLHSLELEGLDYAGRAKVATQLTKCRQLRRQSKDTVEILEPLITFIESEKGKNMSNLLTEVLGKTRKVEENMKKRFYRKRILQGEIRK